MSIALADPIPVSDADPFSAEFFENPFPIHAALRDAGPVVRLSRYDVYAVARYADVTAVLNDWRTFSSARGAGLTDFKKEKPWPPRRECTFGGVRRGGHTLPRRPL